MVLVDQLALKVHKEPQERKETEDPKVPKGLRVL